MANELDLLFDKLKLITPKMRDNEEPDSNAITRACNHMSISALSSFWNKGEEKNPIIGYGLPTNIYHPDQADEYYEALQFFKKHESFFNKRNSKMVLKVMDLFAWNTDKEFKEVFPHYYTSKTNNISMYDTKDIDVRKIAKMFAKDGDLSKGLKDKEEIEKLDKQMATLFHELKLDIINSYKKSHTKTNYTKSSTPYLKSNFDFSNDCERE